MKWTKKSKYHAIKGQYIMSWNDKKEFCLYKGKEFIAAGSRDKCLRAAK